MNKTPNRILLAAALVATGLAASAMGMAARGAEAFGVVDLRCEQLREPINIDTAVPRFSWRLAGEGRGIRQAAYRIRVEEADTGAVAWDSGKVEGEASLWIAYAGRPLASNTPYQWKVRVWAQEGRPGDWSGKATFRTALLKAEDWSAEWIRAPYASCEGHPSFKPYDRLLEVKNNPAHRWVPTGDGIEEWIAAGIQDKMNGVAPEHAYAYQRDRLEELLPAPMFRRVFTVRPGLKSAVLHYCGLGLVEMSANGSRIGDHTWDPAFTDYDKRALYLTADITSMLRPGENALGAMVGDGWYGQSIGFSNIQRSWRYGDPGLIAQLELFYGDGSRERIATDAAWQCTLEGPVVKNNLWAGEFHDAGKEMPGWDTAAFAPDGRWRAAIEVEPLSPRLEAQHVEPIREVETSPIKELTQPKPGIWVADMGRIITGICELNIENQPPGTLLLLTFGQSLNADGTVSKHPGISVGTWPVNAYICRGGEKEAWKPRFTFHSFRYVQIDGLQGTPGGNVLVGRTTSTDMPRAGAFECSVPLFNDLHHALVRTTQANARHFYSDTPSRERTGWMTWPNVLSIFDNFEAYPFFRKWIGDAYTSAKTAEVGDFVTVFTRNTPPFIADSGRQGRRMENVGSGLSPGPRPSPHPEQRISNVMYPWEVYIRYGDIEPIRSHYEIMKGTVDFLAEGRVGGLVPTPIGDWHDAVKPDLNIGYRRERGLERDDTWGAIMGGYPVHTPGRVCGTVHLWLAADALSQIAVLLGHGEDTQRYAALAGELKDAFNRAYLDLATGRYAYTTPKGNTYESQTMYGYALYHGLVPEEVRGKTVQRFLEHIESFGGHPTSGQLGMDRVVKALTDAGQPQAAFDILTVKGFPGFDHMLSFGTETTWETWGEAILNNTPEGSKHIIRSTRPQEHCQWTAVDSWFYEFVLGIRPDPAHPGYKHFTLKPHLFDQMQWARGSYQSPYGAIASAWSCDGKTFEWTVEVPPNTTAIAHIPAKSAESVTESGQPLAQAEGVTFLNMQNSRAVCELQSGTYRFEAVP